MNAETENQAEAGPSVEERRIIGDAIARGGQVTRWTAAIIGLLFFASGLWWAGILVVVITTFDLPRAATRRYARKRGVELDIPSLDAVEKTSWSGLLLALVLIPAICGAVAAEAKLGHPLLPWSWKNPQYRTDDLYFLMPLAFASVILTTTWIVRRRKRNSDEVTR